MGEETELVARDARPDAGADSTYLLLVLGAAAAVFACFSPGLDNFFAGDDFNWLFDVLKVRHHPAHALNLPNGFVRYTETGFFFANLLVGGLHPFGYFLSALLVHLANFLLLTSLLGRLVNDRLAALAGGLFWALHYAHAEAVLRLYGVADALAVLFFLGSLALLVRHRTVLATALFVLALLSKENALVFPLLASGYLLVVEGRRALRRTLPLWACSGLAAMLLAFVRIGASSYLSFNLGALSRIWESLLTYLVTDAVYLRQVVLGGEGPLLPPWLAALLLVPLAAALCWLPPVPRFGLGWTCVAMAPTLLVAHQTSRYHYVPLVGVAVIVAWACGLAVAWLRRRGSRLGLAALLGAGALVAGYLALGVRLQEQDWEREGELHRQAVAAFQSEVLPALLADPQRVAVFVRTDTEPLAHELYPRRPWYHPVTYKWVFRRQHGVLGLTNTWAFVTYCGYQAAGRALFVRVGEPELGERLAAGAFELVSHDWRSNAFRVEGEATRQELLRHQRDAGFSALVQPGRFDPTCSGDLGP